MKNGNYASYNGQIYRYASLKGGKLIKLLSEVYVEGFEKSDDVYRLVVPKSECDRVWRQELFFKYMDSTFPVWDIKGSKLYLRADGNSFDAEKYGFEVCEIEKYGHKIYGKWVDEADGEKEWNITEY